MKRLRDPIEAASPVMKCSLCEDAGWVCESYRDKPWEGPHACQCGAPGAPCTSLQCTNGGDARRMPGGFKTEVDKDGWRH